MQAKHSLNVFGRIWTLLFRVVPEKTKLQYGVGSRCKNGEHVLFLDYDETPLDWVDEEINLLYENFNLGNAYRFKTKNGIHVIFLEKYPLSVVVKMMDFTSCDKQYKEVPMQYGRKIWVLRNSPKKGEEIKYLGSIKHPCYKQRSQAHANYLHQFCGVPKAELQTLGPYDDEKSLTMAYYKISEKNN